MIRIEEVIDSAFFLFEKIIDCNIEIDRINFFLHVVEKCFPSNC